MNAFVERQQRSRSCTPARSRPSAFKQVRRKSTPRPNLAKPAPTDVNPPGSRRGGPAPAPNSQETPIQKSGLHVGHPSGRNRK
jgi:hypothetical protein